MSDPSGSANLDPPEKSLQEESPALRDRLVELEAKLLEQEHRLPRIILSFLDSKQYPKGDPRRAAALRAIIWKVFSPATATIVGGGVIAAASLAVLVWQTTIMKEQNTLFREQTTKIQAQIESQDKEATAQRRTEIIASLYETKQAPGEDGALKIVPAANARTRIEAFREFIKVEARYKGALPVRGPAIDLSFAHLTNVVLVDEMDLHQLVKCTPDRGQVISYS